ncbi:Zn-dependent exopeptidase [Venturia nashicola]|uniref:Zn-dependent exopeptidase n=1 Tax=Venturia nashicola TaxID=86259 RepID=A0A4Z1NYY7_9PEZI|nr:Zn-dependent exopeptidase [Venturia nashicola]
MATTARLSPAACRFSRQSMRPRRHLFGTPFSIQSIRSRGFSASPSWQLHTRDMSESDMSSLRVDESRLMADLHWTCQWGTGERWGDKPTDTGMRRLALSDDDKKARDWFVEAVKAQGCKVTIDSMGNIFAVRPGIKVGPPTYVGSHLDTQPSGGRYDGILGVTAGVEMLKVLNDNWVETEYPVGVINWTNEEGARFPISMVSSAVWAGQIPLSKAQNLKEVGAGTATQKSALERIGYLGTTPASYKLIPIGAHFELHIEQGPQLEAEGRKVGIVKGVQAYKWYTIEVTGRDAHTGTTPLSARADALLTASKMIIHSHKVATKLGALASTGILTLKPGSTNTIPGSVRFSLDIRAPHDRTVENAEREIRDSFAAIAAGNDIGGLNEGTTSGHPCSVNITVDSNSPAIHFNEECIDCVQDAVKGIYGTAAGEMSKEMTSGAGHDSVNTSYIAPTTMIFIPCKDGVSHNPKEYSTPEDCAIGAQVLLQSVLRYDRLRAARESIVGKN